MKFCFGLLILCCCFATGCATRKSSDHSDLDQLQGRWTLISAIKDGTKASPDEIKNASLTIQGNRFSFNAPSNIGTSERGTFTLDPQTRPRAVEATSNKGETSKGIYEIMGDTHRACFAAPGQPRPQTFAAPKGSGWTLQVWKRAGS